MPRPARIQYENAFYHVMNRGRARRWIFHGDKYYEAFLNTLEESHERFEARFHAYCLMGNHYHLLVEIPLANLDRIMRHINGVYTQRHNRFKRTDGPLFRGRYKAILVDESTYLLQVSRYIHRNPIEVKGASRDTLDNYVWSSYLAYINKTKAPAWLSRNLTYQTLGRKNCYTNYHAFVQDGNDARTKEFYGGDCLTGIFGDTSFRQSVCDDQENLPVVEGLSDLIRTPLEMDAIVEAVAKAFDVERSYVVERQAGRRQKNVPRRVAMHCGQRLGGYSQKEIATYFSLSHPGGVASAVKSVEDKVGDGELKRQLAQIRQDLNVVKTT